MLDVCGNIQFIEDVAWISSRNCKKKNIELFSCIVEMNIAGNEIDVMYKNPVINSSIELQL